MKNGWLAQFNNSSVLACGFPGCQDKGLDGKEKEET